VIDSSIYSIHVLVSIIFLFRKAIYAILDSVQNPLGVFNTSILECPP